MRTLTKIIAVLAMFAAGGAAAQPAYDAAAPAAVVSLADLDLGSPAGLRAVQGRVSAAAARLCVQQGRVSLERQLAQRRCLAAAMTSAKATLDRALAQRALQIALRSKAGASAR
jgi:UrcA family protein